MRDARAEERARIGPQQRVRSSSNSPVSIPPAETLPLISAERACPDGQRATRL
jgi:hypothetical protein